MSQPNPNPSQTKPKGGIASFWYVIFFLVVAAMLAGYWVRNNPEEPRPVVSAAEEQANTTEPAPGGESPSTAAALVISSDVRGADVYVNGNRVGKTPHKATPLTPGDYDVKVAHEGYETFEETVHVASPDDSIHAALNPISAENTEEKTAAPAADIRGLGKTAAVKHKHRIGSCEGVLRAGDDGIRYETDHKDGFFVAYSDIEELDLDENELALKVRDGRKYDFNEQADNPETLAALYERAGEAIAMTESADK